MSGGGHSLAGRSGEPAHTGATAVNHTRHVLVNRLATPLGAFVLLIVIGRHSDALLGEYALVMTYYFIMQMLPLLGLTPYLAREVARRPQMAARCLSGIGALSMVGCVMVDLVVFSLLSQFDYSPQVESAIRVVGALIFPGILLFIAEVIFMSLNRARPAAWIAAIENTARVVASLIVLVAGGELLALTWVFFATRCCALLAHLTLLRKTGLVERFVLPDREVLGQTLRVLPVFLIGTLMFVVFSRLDFLVLSAYVRVETLGYYAIGYRPFEIGIILMTALVMVVFPWISRRYATSPHRFGVASRSLLTLFAGILCVGAIVGVVLADTYVWLLFRNQHPHPVLLTQLFLLVLILAGIDYLLSSLLHAADRQADDTRAMAFGGAANLTALLLLVPDWGMYGACAAKVVATAVQCGLKLRDLGGIPGAAWTRGDLPGLATLALLVAASALVSGAPAWLHLLVAAIAIVAVPIVMVATGLARPLRLLRYHWRSRGAADVGSLPDLLDVIVADARAAHRDTHATPRTIQLGAALARTARYVHLRGFVVLAARLAAVGAALTGVKLDPSMARPPGSLVHAGTRA